MRRSQINHILREGAAFIRGFGYAMPPFADWTPAQMRAPGAAALRARGMGWDVTDFGKGRFADLGLLLFTLRNGSAADLSRGGGMLYAEKIMVSRKDQVCPMHRHRLKAEDIVNRGGAALALQLFASDAAGAIDRDAAVNVSVDGCRRRLDPGATLTLDPGESVTLPPGIWHRFWGEGGDVLIGEVSTVNDDRTDNVFDPPLARFADVHEDDSPLRLLVSDYDDEGGAP